MKGRMGQAVRVLVLSAVVMCGMGLVDAQEASAIGLLIPNNANLEPLAIQKHRVDVHMTDGAAVTRVEQVFVNRTNRQLEATFYFPVPPGSTVSDFSLWINGKKTKGAVLEKNKARQIYESIVRRTQDPGLIEYMDGTLFQARIFPVPANGTQKVEIAFASVMDQTGAMRRFLYPLKTGRTAARLIEDFAFTAHIDSKAPLKAIYSPSHAVQVKRDSDHKATVSFTKNAVDLERDFLLYVGASQEDVGLSLLTYDPDGKGGEDGYFLMLLTPREEVDEDDLADKTVTFVVDTSGSMSGEKMDQARRSLLECLKYLGPDDYFNIVRFSTDVEGLFRAPQRATEDNIKHAMGFARNIEASGGTAIDEALETALKSGRPSDMQHFVIFMTDGRPTVGNIDPHGILRQVQQSNRDATRVFPLGIGYNLNTVLLNRLADANGGISDYVRPQEDIQVKVGGLINKIAYPVMTDLKVNYNTQGVYDTYPRRLPDLFRGGQVVVTGRYRNALPSVIELEGAMGGEDLGLRFEEIEDLVSQGSAQVAHDFIPKIWATRKVGYLLDEIRDKGELPELRKEVTRLGQRYGLVTPYTSYLAVDDAEFDQNGRPRPRPPMVRRRFDFDERAEMEDALRDQGRFGGGARASSGKKAVDASIATNKLKEAKNAAEASNLQTRLIDGKLYVNRGGVWFEEGVDAKKPRRRVKVGSSEYFDLMRKRPANKRRMSLDREMVFEDDGVIIETF